MIELSHAAYNSLEATPTEYPELAPVDLTYVDTEQLEFNHWPVFVNA